MSKSPWENLQETERRKHKTIMDAIEQVEDERLERAQEVQQTRRDEHAADVRKEVMDQLRQCPSTWKEGQNEHALSVAARFQEQDILQYMAKNINTSAGRKNILKHVIKIFRDAVEDHLDEYLGDME